MKKFLLLIALPFFFISTLPAQITREQADAIVFEHIQNEVTTPYLLYVNANLPSEEGIFLTTYNEENMKVKYACWAYYLNEHPEVSEPTQHRYLFVKENDGNLLEVITSNNLGQEDLTQWELVSLGVVSIEKSDIRIFPNPTTGEFKVQEFNSSKVQGIEIFDIYGRKFFEQKEILTVLQSYDLTGFPAGIYFIKITTETGIITKKIIKN